MPKDDLSGRVFGRLMVLSFVGYPRPGKALWACRCACGIFKRVYGYHLKNGDTQSCGCYKIEKTKETNSTHGQSRTPLYGVYCTMLARCYNPNSQRYVLYGGRGIKVCARWRGHNGFLNFVSDMGPRPSNKHSVERKNNDQSYSPQNCKWSTQKEQSINRRTNRVIVVKGKKVLLRDRCKELGIPYSRTWWRLSQGWPLQQALFLPVYSRGI